MCALTRRTGSYVQGMDTTASPGNPFVAVLDRVGVTRRPAATAAVFAVTAAAGITQLVHHPVFDQFRRDGAKIDAGQWWRLVTGMFFQDGWLAGMVFNLFALAVVGLVAERVLGHWRWLVVYFGCGLFGQAMSYLWLQPDGAGNSMCVAGLVGALTALLLIAPSRYGVELPGRVRFYALLVPVLACAGTLLHDNHGLPALLGMALGVVLRPRQAQLAG
jgi:membrane associated rhomboid family serine protease